MTLPTSTYWTASEGYEPDNPLGAMPVLPTGIDAQGDVVNSLAAMHSFRDHELFVFSPGKLGGKVGHHSACASALR